MARVKIKAWENAPQLMSVVVKKIKNKIPYETKQFTTTENECYYCETQLTKFTRTRDHIKPKSKGNKLTDNNKAWACFICNTDKGDLTLRDWAQKLKKMKNVPQTKANKLHLVKNYDTIIKKIELLDDEQ